MRPKSFEGCGFCKILSRPLLVVFVFLPLSFYHAPLYAFFDIYENSRENASSAQSSYGGDCKVGVENKVKVTSVDMSTARARIKGIVSNTCKDEKNKKVVIECGAIFKASYGGDYLACARDSDTETVYFSSGNTEKFTMIIEGYGCDTTGGVGALVACTVINVGGDSTGLYIDLYNENNMVIDSGRKKRPSRSFASIGAAQADARQDRERAESISSNAKQPEKHNSIIGQWGNKEFNIDGQLVPENLFFAQFEKNRFLWWKRKDDLEINAKSWVSHHGSMALLDYEMNSKRLPAGEIHYESNGDILLCIKMNNYSDIQERPNRETGICLPMRRADQIKLDSKYGLPNP